MSRMIAHVDGLLYERSPVGLATQLGGRAGIGRVDVDASAGEVTIVYDEFRVPAPELLRLIAECGYDCCWPPTPRPRPST